jgi:predicted TIM-barrel fold metal-dependent hydrolase
VAQWCAAHPDRFSGLAGADPTRGMQQLRDLQHAADLGFVGVHAYPHWFSLPPDAAQWYPIYAKCCELDLPFMLQVGQNLIYQKDVRLPSVARPILLDRVAIDFPELTLIGIHLGVPWIDEMIAMAWKHERVYIGLDAYAPKHLPASMVHYMDSYGNKKVLFGSDWPVIDPRRGVREMQAHHLRPESWQLVMRDNAMRIFPKMTARMKL